MAAWWNVGLALVTSEAPLALDRWGGQGAFHGFAPSSCMPNHPNTSPRRPAARLQALPAHPPSPKERNSTPCKQRQKLHPLRAHLPAEVELHAAPHAAGLSAQRGPAAAHQVHAPALGGPVQLGQHQQEQVGREPAQTRSEGRNWRQGCELAERVCAHTRAQAYVCAHGVVCDWDGGGFWCAWVCVSVGGWGLRVSRRALLLDCALGSEACALC